MPAKISKNQKGGYSVRTPNGVHSKNTTMAKAQTQRKLLNAVDHGWKPTRGRGGEKKVSRRYT